MSKREEGPSFLSNGFKMSMTFFAGSNALVVVLIYGRGEILFSSAQSVLFSALYHGYFGDLPFFPHTLISMCFLPPFFRGHALPSRVQCGHAFLVPAPTEDCFGLPFLSSDILSAGFVSSDRPFGLSITRSGVRHCFAPFGLRGRVREVSSAVF